MKCEECGLESTSEAFFQKIPRIFGTKTRSVCPDCVAIRDDAVYRFLFWTCLALTVAGLVLAVAAPGIILGPALLNIAALEASLFISTVLHEVGHALAARLVGSRPFFIEIGGGRVALEFLLWGFRWQFRSIPMGGFAHTAAKDTRWHRVRESVIDLGGPAANGALLAVGLSARSGESGLDAGFLNSFTPATMFCLANAVLLLYSLWPREVDTTYGRIPNDALRLWREWRKSQAEVERAPAAFYFHEGLECRRQHNYIEAQRHFEEGLRRFPRHWMLESAAGANLLSLRRYTEAKRVYVQSLGRWSKSAELRCTLFNNIAYSNLLIGDRSLLWQTDACSRAALESMPGSVYFKGTRGSVLVELSQIEEGILLLHQALKANLEKDGRALNACYLGIAEARRGNPAVAKSYFALARKLDRDCLLLERESVELDSGAEGEG